MAIKWPYGKAFTDFCNAIAPYHETILRGKLLAIDPASGASSMPGYCYCENGKIVASGTIKLDSKLPVHKRLKQLYTELASFIGDPDVLVIEKLRGSKVHTSLTWSVGVTVAAVSAPLVVELPIPIWKAIQSKGYVKGDEADAKEIARATLAVAKMIKDADV